MEGAARNRPAELIQMGSWVRALRKQRAMSLEQLSAKSGVALATLSRIENGKGPGTFRTHQKLADAFGLTLPDFYRNLRFEDSEPALQQSRGEAETFTYDEKATSVLLARQSASKQMFPQMLFLKPGGKTALEQYSLGTDRWLFGLEGAVVVTVGSKEYRLEEGGTLYFKATLPHRAENRSQRLAKVISVTSPATF